LIVPIIIRVSIYGKIRRRPGADLCEELLEGSEANLDSPGAVILPVMAFWVPVSP
jgi:hypothetical protein